jgi:hypothetical protein
VQRRKDAKGREEMKKGKVVEGINNTKAFCFAMLCFGSLFILFCFSFLFLFWFSFAPLRLCAFAFPSSILPF